MTVAREILYTGLLVFLLLLIFRLVMDYVFMFARGFRPQGMFAMALELAYSATDPPLKAVRRVLPPLRVGTVSIDLGFFVVFVVTSILMSVVAP
ncbi:MAG TPA: YggT family protein [Mycobacteriales bacterium]|nr:YggT family protein [Mycobacteriales bacterium]